MNTRAEHSRPLGNYIIYSPSEASKFDGEGFWSKEYGWTVCDDATQFSPAEMQKFDLPISTGNDAQWVLVETLRTSQK